MFRIAICDDDPVVCGLLAKYLKQIEKDIMTTFEIEIFYSGQDLNKYIFESSVVFDIIFLDIELPEIDGIEIGSRIRNNFRSEIIQIVYISSHRQYAMDLFQVHPAAFIVKPLDYEEVEKTIKYIINIIFKQTEIFDYSIGHQKYKIELYKVLYFTSSRRKIIIKTFKNNLINNEFYGKISDISERLLKLDFFLANSYYLVNYYAVTEFQYKKIKLINGEEINISQTFRNGVRDMQMSKWRGR